ncbi:unnamed protein product [Cuscuta campestris]|uniref:Protein kinase domain-containing protein n=1 Tax=Cuscuta campestris TaxID=132261 RepID=A0A484M3Z4_9ASTE|nr:unnamed protein product [Cuscuta campestris]
MAALKKPRSKYSCLPSVLAVKSAEVSASGSIQKEREVLDRIKGNPYVIRCFGEETTTGENGDMIYNLLLEYGSGGTLAERIKRNSEGNNKGLPELEVRFHTRSLLRGLIHIHMIGYVHCDLKPDNVLLLPSPREVGGVKLRAKIGDFGLAKRGKQSKKRRLEPYWRGTPMYLSPEVVKDGVQEAPCDIWALECVVLQMLTGEPPWAEDPKLEAKEVLAKIKEGKTPKIPCEISKEARDFLKGCFVKKDMYRLTAEMLLNHPFVQGLVDDDDDGDDYWHSEGAETVGDINVIDTISLSTDIDEDEDDDDSMYTWSLSDEDDNHRDTSSCNEGTIEGEENLNLLIPIADACFDTSSDALLDVPCHARHKYAFDYTISAGV